MKLIKLLALAIAGMTLAACASHDTPPPHTTSSGTYVAPSPK
ncbi:MAG TPA: hypothetical protein VMN36_09280 [Verrucomicrobiales bacterium]|nr:hypothetical protein [Verrucomicrobiales bacterium]